MFVQTTLIAEHIVELLASELFWLLRVAELCGLLFERLLLAVRHCIGDSFLGNRA